MKFNKTLSSTIAATVLAFSVITSAQAVELVKAEPINIAEITKAAQENITQSINLLPLDIKVTQANISSMLTANVKESDGNSQSVTKIVVAAAE